MAQVAGHMSRQSDDPQSRVDFCIESHKWSDPTFVPLDESNVLANSKSWNYRLDRRRQRQYMEVNRLDNRVMYWTESGL